jgi:hypothetical protein
MHIRDENGAGAYVFSLDSPHRMLEHIITTAMKNIPLAIATTPVISMVKLAADAAYNRHPAPLQKNPRPQNPAHRNCFHGGH